MSDGKDFLNKLTESNEEREPVYEMARVGKMLDKYNVCVYEGERPVPHFHIYIGQPKSATWESCVRIDVAAYFNHKPHMVTMNSQEKKALVVFLKGLHEEFPDMTRWEYIKRTWNTNNPEYRTNVDKMPNYSRLKNAKEGFWG